MAQHVVAEIWSGLRPSWLSVGQDVWYFRWEGARTWDGDDRMRRVHPDAQLAVGQPCGRMWGMLRPQEKTVEVWL